jgi:hypothetical protein
VAVIGQLGDDGLTELELLLSRTHFQSVPIDANHLH